MTSLAKELSYILDGREDKGYPLNIKPKITTNGFLRGTLTDLLENDEVLRMISHLKKLDSIEEIWEYHLKKDKQTGEHEKRVADYCREMAEHCSLDSKKMFRGGLVHDIGKLPLITLGYLHKSLDRSTEPHKIELVAYGHAILGKLFTHIIDPLKENPYSKMISEHHDNLSEGGYPHITFIPSPEVEALQIPDAFDLNYVEAGKVADNFDGMKRGIYQRAYSDEEAYMELINKSRLKILNPEYVDIFLSKVKGLDKKYVKKLKNKN